MTFIKTPMKGMPEQLPDDMQVKEYALSKIKQTYGRFGFSLIETPCIEHIENLTNNQGGENEKLIFKILKRGEKLEESIAAGNLDELSDSGLRYDLTVPLSRFYANNANVLPMPFKAFQVGNVWRADRPQKGRFRQFMQCDIDIIGDSSNLAEIELISSTVTMLGELGLGNVTVRINDRRLLKSMATACNIEQDKLNSVFIALDKLDKIGLDGVKEELAKLEINNTSIEQYCSYFANTQDATTCKQFFEQFTEAEDKDASKNIDDIIYCVKDVISKNGKIVFDPTLVRGMSYYTGTIFEISLEEMNMSIAGGGRYDKMIGEFCGLDVPACGFSIGFERILWLLKQNNFRENSDKQKIAYLISKDVSVEKTKQTMQVVAQKRANGEQVLISPRNKNVKLQKERLFELGYTKFIDVFEDTEI